MGSRERTNRPDSTTSFRCTYYPPSGPRYSSPDIELFPALPCRVVLNVQSRPLDTAMKLSIQKGWLRLGAVCGAAAGMGAGVELFMIKTGFCELCINAPLSSR